MKISKKVCLILIILLASFYMLYAFKSDSNLTNTNLKTNIKSDLKGYKVAFASDRGDNNVDIWFSDPDGSNQKCLTDSKDGIDMYPEWGPESKYIYYTSNKHGGTMELYRICTNNNSKPEQLSLFDREVRSLSVSNDNKYIALGIMSSNVPFGSDLKDYSADLYILETKKMNEFISNNKLLTIKDLNLLLSNPQEEHIWYEQPDFQKLSHDDKPVLAFVRTENYDNDKISKDEIWTINVDGSNLKKILDNMSMPRWTFDDSKIITHEFNVLNLSNNNVNTLKIDGLNNSAGAASISPDNKYVIFEMSDENRKAGLARIIYSNENKKNPITKFSDRQIYEPRWSPTPLITH